MWHDWQGEGALVLVFPFSPIHIPGFEQNVRLAGADME
jgi:hypothetical protein